MAGFMQGTEEKDENYALQQQDRCQPSGADGQQTQRARANKQSEMKSRLNQTVSVATAGRKDLQSVAV